MTGLLNKLRKILPPSLKWKALLLMFCMALFALLELAGIALLMPVISAVAAPETLETNSILQFLYRHSPAENVSAFILFSAAALIIFYLLKNVIGMLLIKFQSSFSMQLSNNVAERLFHRYLYAPYQYYAQENSASMVICLNRIHDFMVDLILPLLFIGSELCVFIATGLTICIISPAVAVFSVAVTAAALFLFYLPLRKKMERCGKINHETSENLMDLLEQSFQSMELMRLTRSAPYFENLFRNIHSRRTLAQKHSSEIGQIPRFAMETFGVVLAMGIIMILIHSGTGDILLYGTFFAVAMIRLMPGISRIQYNLLHIRNAAFLFHRIYQDLTQFPEEQIPAEPEKELPFRKELTVQDLAFSYEHGTPVFRDLSLRIAYRECVALTGKTGCGKTTLVHLIAGLLKPDSGTILADGENIAGHLIAWQSKIGYVPQKIYLQDTTIRENVAFGIAPEKIDDDRVRYCLHTAQLSDFVQSLPEGILTKTGQAGNRLSGGQRQRIAIARALYRDPELLILDEATSALDSETEKAFIDALTSLRGKITMIVIAHRQSSIDCCDREIRIS